MKPAALDGLAHRTARWFLYLLFLISPFSIASIELAFPVLLIAWLAGWKPWAGSSPSLWRTPELRPVLLPLLIYLALCAFSIFTSSNAELSLKGFIGKTLQYLLFFVILADVANHPGVARTSVKMLVVAGFVICLYGLWQEWAVFHHAAQPGGAFDPVRGKKLIYDRMVGPYSNPIDMATFLMVASLLILPQLLSKPALSQPAGWGAWLLMTGCIAWTESKGAVLGLSCGLVMLLALSWREKRVWIALGTFAAIVLALFVWKEKNLIPSLADPGFQERTVMWSTAWEMIKAKPIFGHGLNTFMSNYMAYVTGPNQGPAYAHNCFLQVAAETGVISLFFYVVLLAATFRVYFRSLGRAAGESRTLLVGMACALFAFLVQSGIETSLYSVRQATLFWSLAGVAVGFGYYKLKCAPKSAESC